jgi:hypothetical protein
MRQTNIKKYFVEAILITALLTVAAVAEEGGPDYFKVTGVAVGDTLNIHTEPHAKSKVIGEVARETDCLRNLGCKGGLTFQEFTSLSKVEQEQIKKERPRWCKIAFDGVEGWVYARYLQEGSCSK